MFQKLDHVQSQDCQLNGWVYVKREISVCGKMKLVSKIQIIKKAVSIYLALMSLGIKYVSISSFSLYE